MEKPVKTPKQAFKLMIETWRRAGSFFASIEVWLMVLVAAAMVGGVFLAAMGDARSLLAVDSRSATWCCGQCCMPRES